MTNALLDCTDAAFDHDVLHTPGVVLVDFWAEWCAPCRALSPILERVAQAYQGKARVVKVNADDNRQTAERFGIQGLPTMLIFKNGEMVQRLVGMTTQPRIAALLDKHLESPASAEEVQGDEARTAPAWFLYAAELLSNLVPQNQALDWKARWQRAGVDSAGDAAAPGCASRLIQTLLDELKPELQARQGAEPLLSALEDVMALHATAAAGEPSQAESWKSVRAKAVASADAIKGPDLNEVAACIEAAAWDPVVQATCLGEVLNAWIAYTTASFDRQFGWTADDNAQIRTLLGQMQAEHIDNRPEEVRDVFMLLREHHPAVEARLLDYTRRRRQWHADTISRAAERLADIFVAR